MFVNPTPQACYQVSQQIVLGKFPLNKELALELAALMAQVNISKNEYSRNLITGRPDIEASKSMIPLYICFVFRKPQYPDKKCPDIEALFDIRGLT